MAIKGKSLKQAQSAVAGEGEEEVISLELFRATSFTHMRSGLTFRKGGVYKFKKSDANMLLGLVDDQGVPHFKLFVAKPTPAEVRAEGDAVQAAQGVVSLPDSMRKGDTSSMAGPDAAPTAPLAMVGADESGVEVVVASEDVTDTGEIDTGAGVEV